jgi:hypothetical protein
LNHCREIVRSNEIASHDEIHRHEVLLSYNPSTAVGAIRPERAPHLTQYSEVRLGIGSLQQVLDDPSTGQHVIVVKVGELVGKCPNWDVAAVRSEIFVPRISVVDGFHNFAIDLELRSGRHINQRDVAGCGLFTERLDDFLDIARSLVVDEHDLDPLAISHLLPR